MADLPGGDDTAEGRGGVPRQVELRSPACLRLIVVAHRGKKSKIPITGPDLALTLNGLSLMPISLNSRNRQLHWMNGPRRIL